MGKLVNLTASAIAAKRVAPTVKKTPEERFAEVKKLVPDLSKLNAANIGKSLFIEDKSPNKQLRARNQTIARNLSVVTQAGEALAGHNYKVQMVQGEGIYISRLPDLATPRPRAVYGRKAGTVAKAPAVANSGAIPPAAPAASGSAPAPTLGDKLDGIAA